MKLKYLVLLIMLLSYHSVSAQDHPVDNSVKVLPFQRDASDNTDDKLAMQYYQSREFDKAAEIYERLYEKSPNTNNYILLLYCLLETRDFKKAEKLIKNQSKNEPGSLKYLVDLGYLSYRQGDPEKSKKYYDEALKKLTSNQQQIFELANAFSMREENDYAIATYKKGRDLLNNAYPFGFELAAVYERMGDFKNMLEEYIRMLETNKSYLQTIEDRLQFTLSYDPDNSRNETFRKYILEKAQKEPDKPWYAELLWWYSVQQKDFSMALIQAKSLDRRLKEDGNRVFQMAQLSLSNEDYESAIDGFGYLVTKGTSSPYYWKARTELLNTKFKKILATPNPSKESLTEIEKEFVKETSAEKENSDNIELYRNYAHLLAFYLDKSDQAMEILNRILNNTSVDPKQKAECKVELGDIDLFTGDVWEATLLYQQVYQDFKNDVMGETAKFRNAKLSYYIGEFKWAQTQLDILKAATSRLIANDAMELSLLIRENFDPDSGNVALTYYSHADLLDFRNHEEAAITTLDSIFKAFSWHEIFDEVLLKKANIKLKQGKIAEADTLLGTLITNYPEGVRADEALFLRARINEDKKDKAMIYYSELMSKYPGSVYVVDARKRYRTLRGDNIQ